MHLLVRRHPSNTEPIKSKEELVFHCGFRRFRASPIFSQHTSGTMEGARGAFKLTTQALTVVAIQPTSTRWSASSGRTPPLWCRCMLPLPSPQQESCSSNRGTMVRSAEIPHPLTLQRLFQFGLICIKILLYSCQ